MNLTQRVFAGSLVIVGVLAILVVAVADRRLEQSLVEDSIQELGREARLVADQWKPRVNADSLADQVGRFLQHRVTLIDTSGQVLGDSEFDPPSIAHLENHRTRPEILQAVREG